MVTEVQDIQFRVHKVIDSIISTQEANLNPETRLREDLGADSLDLVEIVMALEEEFGGEISDEDAQHLATVGEVIVYIYQYLQNQ